jgi:hypothetical protein
VATAEEGRLSFRLAISLGEVLAMATGDKVIDQLSLPPSAVEALVSQREWFRRLSLTITSEQRRRRLRQKVL